MPFDICIKPIQRFKALISILLQEPFALKNSETVYFTSICRAVIRHLQESKLTRDMMVMKAVTAWCCRVRSAAPEIQFPIEQRGSILYSFLLYPLHKIFSHLQNKKVRNNVFFCI